MDHGEESRTRAAWLRACAVSLTIISMLSSWSLVLADAPSPPPADEAAARTAVARAELLFRSSNYDAALTDFVAAYDLMANHPRRFAVLFNIAVCHERQFRYDLALEYYERYLAEGGEAADDAEHVRSVISALRELLVPVTITTNVRASVWVDGHRVGQAPGVVSIPAGRHAIELHAAHYASERVSTLLIAGRPQRLEFVLERVSQFTGLSPTYFWVGASLTAAALGTGLVLGGVALSLDSEGHERARRDAFLNTVEDRGAVQRTATAADIAFIGAAAFAASSLVLFFLTDFGDPAAPPERAPATTARLQLGAGSLLLSGSY